MDTQCHRLTDVMHSNRDKMKESPNRLCPSQPPPSETHPAQQKSCYRLVKSSSLLLVCGLFVVLTSTLIGQPRSVESVIMPPPKINYMRHDNHGWNGLDVRSDHLIGDEESYILTINEHDGIDVSINSRSNITINLNMAVPAEVTVKVAVYSGPNLIVFDRPKNQLINDTSISRPESAGSHITAAEYLVIYEMNEFGDRPVYFHTTGFAGHAKIVCKVLKQPLPIVIDDKLAYTSVNIYRLWYLNYLIQVVGWIYSAAWSLSFYFQVTLNYKRKSVVGLNFDFLCLNLLGFACYSIYNITLLFSDTVQQEYYKSHQYTRIPVEYSDLFFALHAFLITLVTVMQCFFYERGDQNISLPAGIFAVIAPMLGFGLFLASLWGKVSVLNVVLYLSYVKLVITIIKYAPQAYMNYSRKATTGWSIHNIMLDFTGGTFSLLHMFMLSYNYDDWISLFGNFTKFGLGLISMLFDIVFFVQHYVLYKSGGQASLANEPREDLENSSDSCPSPVISQSIRSTNNQSSQAVRARGNDSNGESDESSD